MDARTADPILADARRRHAAAVAGLWTCRRNLRRGVLIGGIVGLFYFCHGVSVAWDDAPARIPALIEIALTLLVIGASGWDARKYKRPAK